MKVVSIFDRRFRGRLALLGITQRRFCEIAEVSYVSLRTWLQMPTLPQSARKIISKGLGVDDSWIDSDSLEDVGEGLDVICKK
tara:strand:- start:374 stop:622 length:249 start_codon:yes stop_codon:yes gene_type:complete